jgi:hypothetical protein
MFLMSSQVKKFSQCELRDKKHQYFSIVSLPTDLGGDSRNFANLQIVNETANTMLQQCRLSWF